MPKKAILQDLAKDILTWQTAGKTVIVPANFNEDVCSPELTQFFWEFDLVEAVMGINHGQAQAMHNRGSKPIDSIFVPAQFLQHCCGGYFDLGEGVLSNHQAVWLDIPADLVCSHQAEQPA